MAGNELACHVLMLLDLCSVYVGALMWVIGHVYSRVHGHITIFLKCLYIYTGVKSFFQFI